MKTFLNLKHLFAYCVIIIMSCTILLYAYSSGITGVTKKAINPGCTCHGLVPSTNVIVTITGPDSLMPNQSANYSVTISGGPLKAAGTDIAVSNGTLSPVSNDLRILNGELTHVKPKQPSNNVVTFDFIYTAPSELGEHTIYANGNSVNFNGQNTGDQWNFAPNKIIQVGAVTGIADNKNIYTYELAQNFPNPFNPTTTIQYSVPSVVNANFTSTTLVLLKVYDILGREVATLVNQNRKPGQYKVTFNAGDLASGVYYYVLRAANFVTTKKMILLR